MAERVDGGQQDPSEILAFLNRLSRDKRAVSAHLAIKVDLEHGNSTRTNQAPRNDDEWQRKTVS